MTVTIITDELVAHCIGSELWGVDSHSNYLWTKSCGVFIEMKLLILSPFVSNYPFKF